MAMCSLAGFRNRNLICGVCQDVYRSPRLLPCHHTFCLTCIEGLARHSSRFICPQCRKPVELPTEGPLGFQVNFYLDEEQLELARKGPGNTICSTHGKDTEPLVFYCQPCDKAICIRCKLTEHEGHKTEDLSRAAERCVQPLEEAKTRLDETIGFLAKKSEQAHEDLKAAKQKAMTIEEQVTYQGDVLVARIKKAVETVLEKVKATSQETEQELSQTAGNIQTNLDSLTQLRQKVHHALEGADADKVCTEREMRDGDGSTEKLQAICEAVPKLTIRSVMRTNDTITDGAIFQYLGKPRKETSLSQPPSEELTLIAKAGLGKPFRRIHSLYALNEVLRINIGGTSPNYKDASIHRIQDYTECTTTSQFEVCGTKDTGKCSMKSYHETLSFYSTYGLGDQLEIMSKAETLFEASNMVQYGKSTVQAITPKGIDAGVDTSPRTIATFATGKLIAFDATADGTKFVMVEEIKKSNRKTMRVVRLYDPTQTKAVDTYTPQDDSFEPMDVCFWHNEDEAMLLIADFQNDCIHMVDTTDNELKFVRYLAAGSGYLVRPTALNVDEDGRVLFGCDNGHVLLCEKFDPQPELALLDALANPSETASSSDRGDSLLELE